MALSVATVTVAAPLEKREQEGEGSSPRPGAQIGDPEDAFFFAMFQGRIDR